MSSGAIRLFVALELPGEAVEALVDWREAEAGARRGLRFLQPEHLHATLCFLGWQGEEEIETIGAACRAAAGSVSAAFGLSIGRAVWLPPRRPRVLAVELEDPDGSLARFQAALSRGLENGGWYEPERRAYLPHVTVARARRDSSLRASPLAGPRALSFVASRVTLFRSRLRSSGAEYEALDTVEVG